MIQLGQLNPADLPTAPRASVSILVPIRTKTGLNSREHWAARAARVKKERHAVKLHWQAAKPLLLEPPFRITLTRVSPRLADLDNVVGGLKAARDQIAEQLGIDDGDECASWVYLQRKGPWGVEVRVEGGMEAPF